MKKEYDKLLLVTVIILCWIGILAVFSASTEISYAYYGTRYKFLIKQFIFFIMGAFAMFYVAKMPLDYLQKYTKIALISILVALILVILVGTEIKGAKRWLNLGVSSFQPATVAQLILILFTADYLYRKHDEMDQFKRVYPLFIVVGLVGVLIAVEPDFSTAAMLAMVVFLMVFVSPVSMKHIGLISLSGLVLMIPIFFLKAYRIKRLFGWLTGTESSSLEINYQASQSVISFGQGGITGTGLGLSKQKFFFLPESHTDYILAIIGEEMGFIFVMIVISCLLIFVWRGLRIANRATNLYHFYLAIGITVYIGLYAFVNTMIVIGILPTTGLPLPFISYGGSQLLINMICTGILLNISAAQSESAFRFAGSES